MCCVDLNLKMMITCTVFSLFLDIILSHIFISHHAGNELQMNATEVTKDKLVS